MENQLKICPDCGKATSYIYYKHRYICDACGWEEKIEEVDNEETESDRMMRELFLDKVCKNYRCGSQRCDGGPAWVSGCTLYEKFKQEVDVISERLIKE